MHSLLYFPPYFIVHVNATESRCLFQWKSLRVDNDVLALYHYWWTQITISEYRLPLLDADHRKWTQVTILDADHHCLTKITVSGRRSA